VNITEIFSLSPGENLTLLFSGVVAFSTVVYAILTWQLVKENRKIRETQTEPVISIFIVQSEQWINLIDLVVRNIGLGPAYNLEFSVEPDFVYEKGRKLSEINFIKNGIQYLPPHQEIRFFLTSLVEDYQTKKETPFKISVIYENYSKKKYKQEYPIDFSIWDGLFFIGKNSLVKISDSLENIKKDLHNLTTGFNKMEIISYAKEDLEREEEKHREWRQERKKSREKRKDPY